MCVLYLYCMHVQYYIRMYSMYYMYADAKRNTKNENVRLDALIIFLIE